MIDWRYVIKFCVGHRIVPEVLYPIISYDDIIRQAYNMPSSKGIVLVGFSYCCLAYMVLFMELHLHGHSISHDLHISRWNSHTFKHFSVKFSLPCWWSLCYFLSLIPSWTSYSQGELFRPYCIHIIQERENLLSSYSTTCKSYLNVIPQLRIYYLSTSFHSYESCSFHGSWKKAP